VGIIEFTWGCSIAIGPLIAEYLYNKGGFNLSLYVFASLMLVIAASLHFLMSDTVEGESNEETKELDRTESLSDIPTIVGTETEKISIWKLFTYKLFIFGLCSAFFNLILYTLLEPILTNRLMELGVKEENLGEYF
jgi:uncharacterized protein involved in cysteine biosynthesis